MSKCRICKNWNPSTEECSNCNFEFDKDAYFSPNTPFDILNLDDDLEWSHLQILDRLHAFNIQCYIADIWTNNNVAYLIGCNADNWRIAEALSIHEEVIYNDTENAFVFINLFQEKYLRGLLKD